MGVISRLILVAVSVAIFSATYLGVQHINPFGMVARTLPLPGEDLIPFIPSFFPVYLSAYLLFPIVFLSAPTSRDVWLMIRVFLVACVIHYLFFILMPVQYDLRPEEVEGVDLMSRMITVFYALDKPLNCFPSMHVSFVFLCYYFAREHLPMQARAIGWLAFAIAVSTLLVKQHYVLDAAAGIVVAWILNAVMILPFYRKQAFERLTH